MESNLTLMKGALNPRIIEQERVFMNTIVNITVFSDRDRKEVELGLDAAFSKFRYVVGKFTRFENTSELSMLNNSRKEFTASKELFFLIEFCLELANETNGAFDPTIIDLLEAYGYKKGYDFSILDQREKIQNEIKKITESRASFKDIKMDRKNFSITLAENQRVELGAVGKGYAIDLAAKVLEPFKNFLINAGGDIYASGTNKLGKPWVSGLLLFDEKKNSEMVGKIELKNQALASSGSWARKVKYFHHLLSPKTGEPINEIMQTFTTAKSAMEADAYSTVLFVSGKSGLKILEKNGIDGMIVDASGEKFRTEGFKYEEN